MLDRLVNQFDQFDFFAAVRLLERYYRSGQTTKGREAVGEDYDPRREIVRFRALPSASFATSDVAAFKNPPARDDRTSDPAEMVVTFLGMAGANGALPQHYTSLLLSRLRRRDFALRDFLDLFNHRLISLFYRAWEKNRFPVLYERSRHGRADARNVDDVFTTIMRSLVGMGTAGQQNRMAVDDATFLHYAGQFSSQFRPAAELQRILAEHFRAPVEVESFFGRWLPLDRREQSRLTARAGLNGGNNRLGVDVVVGNRVWDIQGSFRLRVGPLRHSEFRQFQPSGRRLKALCQMTRMFVGPEFAFDVQVQLMKEEVPECRLESRPSAESDDVVEGPRLGWNTWLRSKPFEHDAADAVFELETA